METLYLITYDNAHWCGGELNVVVKGASSAQDAELAAEYHMEEEQRGLFMDEYEEEGYGDECAYNIISIEEFGPKHEQWEFYMDPVQRANFYPEVEAS